MDRNPHPALFFALILPYGRVVRVRLGGVPVHRHAHRRPDRRAGRHPGRGRVRPARHQVPLGAGRRRHADEEGLVPDRARDGDRGHHRVGVGPHRRGPAAAADVGDRRLADRPHAAEHGVRELPRPQRPIAEKGRAAGWYQAGLAVGVGCGGGAALWLSQHLPSGWMVGAIVGGAMLVCALPLLRLREPPPMGHSLGEAMRALGRDLKTIALSRTGILGVIICLSPIGAGAASNYFGPNADGWGASANVVALVTGVIGGLVMAVGAVAGGRLSDRIGRIYGYAVGGGLTALTGVAMAAAPHTPWAYVLFTLTYSFFNGVAAAGFTGLVLETIGRGAVATKYNIFASLANIAISYTTRLDGKAQTRWGANGMFYTDAALTFAGIAVLIAATALLRPRPAVAPALS